MSENSQYYYDASSGSYVSATSQSGYNTAPQSTYTPPQSLVSSIGYYTAPQSPVSSTGGYYTATQSSVGSTGSSEASTGTYYTANSNQTQSDSSSGISGWTPWHLPNLAGSSGQGYAQSDGSADWGQTQLPPLTYGGSSATPTQVPSNGSDVAESMNLEATNFGGIPNNFQIPDPTRPASSATDLAQEAQQAWGSSLPNPSPYHSSTSSDSTLATNYLPPGYQLAQAQVPPTQAVPAPVPAPPAPALPQDPYGQQNLADLGNEPGQTYQGAVPQQGQQSYPLWQPGTVEAVSVQQPQYATRGWAQRQSQYTQQGYPNMQSQSVGNSPTQQPVVPEQRPASWSAGQPAPNWFVPPPAPM